jgi:hypothetical protein
MRSRDGKKTMTGATEEVAMAAITRLNAACEHAATRADGTLDFTVHLLAEDSDGRVHTVLDDRGFSLSIHPPGRDLWDTLSAASLCADAKGTLLPDDDNGEILDWDLVVSLLSDLGVRTSPGDLKHVPYDVTLSDAILRRLNDLHPYRGVSPRGGRTAAPT